MKTKQIRRLAEGWQHFDTLVGEFCKGVLRLLRDRQKLNARIASLPRYDCELNGCACCTGEFSADMEEHPEGVWLKREDVMAALGVKEGS